MTSSDSIHQVCLDAISSKNCIGLIAWMHTFSPARMWIAGLRLLNKPYLHLHTQFNEELPWSTIDMNFMNLNQSAHGDREFGFVGARMRLHPKVVVGSWRDTDVHAEAYAVAEPLRSGGRQRQAMREAARIELGLRRFLEESGSNAFTDTFEDLHGLAQLPGIAVQRLMADGYGFGAEGDWKTPALVRAMKVMSHGLKGGTSFMEDLHLSPEKWRSGAWGTHAGGMSVDRRGQAVRGNPSAFHRWQRRPCPAGICGFQRDRGECFCHRPGEPFSSNRQSGEFDTARAASAEIARGKSNLDT
jgi:L-arabinose isomerase